MDNQMTIFDYIDKDNEDIKIIKINKPIRLIELFAGLGAQAKALSRLGSNFEHYKISEWDVHACSSYHQIHLSNDSFDYSNSYSDNEVRDMLFALGISTNGKQPMERKEIQRKNINWCRDVFNDFIATNNLGSITKTSGKELEIIDTDKYTYILTWSFPCTDLSIAGRQEGMTKDTGTASSLCWEVIRLLKESDNLPDILIMENVPQIHGKKFIKGFEKLCNELENLGYTNFWKDLNAKDFGVPQSRNRCFMISILNDSVSFEFPEFIDLNKTMADCLEPEVEEKYYIDNDKTKKLINQLLEKGLDSEKATIDLTINSPRQVEIANCIKARYDAGVSNQKADGTGVIEKSRE